MTYTKNMNMQASPCASSQLEPAYDIEDYVKQYLACIRLSPLLPAKVLINHDVPQGPLQEFGADLMDWDCKQFLLIIDYISNYPFFIHISSTTTNATINCLTELFTINRFPQAVFTDSGQPFNSKEW